MADETEVVAGPEAGVEPAAVADPAPAVAEPAPSPAPASPSPAQPPRWALERIAEERRKGEEAATAAAQRAEAAERRAAELEAMIQRFQTHPADPAKPGVPAPAQAPPPRDPVSGRFVSPDEPKDWNAAVQAEAERRLFIADCQGVGNLGGAEFTGREGRQSWNDVLGVLAATGANSDDCLKDVIAVDRVNAHKLLAHIAEDGERAVRFAQMPSRQRIVELTKMSQNIAPAAATAATAEPAKPAVPPASRAPAPKPSLAPTSPAAELDPTKPEDNEKLTDAQWGEIMKRNPERISKRLFGAR